MNQEDLIVLYGEMKEMIESQLLLMIMIIVGVLENGLVLEIILHLGILL